MDSKEISQWELLQLFIYLSPIYWTTKEEEINHHLLDAWFICLFETALLPVWLEINKNISSLK